MPWQHVTEGINIYTIDLLLLNRAEGNTKLCMFPILLRKFIVQSSINIRHYRNQSIFYNDLKQLILLIRNKGFHSNINGKLPPLFDASNFIHSVLCKIILKKVNRRINYWHFQVKYIQRPNTSIDILTFAPTYDQAAIKAIRQAINLIDKY